jgi:mono/diheme cytochrome c family protein
MNLISARLDLKRSKVVIVLCFLFLAFTAVHSRSQPSDTTLTTNPVYGNSCAKCHGANAEGRHFRGPSLISGKVSAASEDELRNIITNGKGHMPKFNGKLKSDDIDVLVQQIELVNKK